MGEIEIQKFVALNEEFDTANKLMRLGLGELENLFSAISTFITRV